MAAPVKTHLSVLNSGADKTVRVWNGPNILLEAAVTIEQPEIPLGTHVFSLLGSGPGGHGLRWSGTSLDSARNPESIIHRAQMSDKASRQIIHLLHPGATLMITDRPASEETRSRNGFVVIAQVQP